MMSTFDDALAQADDSLFAEMGSTILFNGIAVNAVVSPLSSYQTIPDGSGGFQKLEGAKAEIITSEAQIAMGGTLRTGMPAMIGSRSYRVVEIKENGATSTIILSSTAGTAAQF